MSAPTGQSLDALRSEVDRIDESLVRLIAERVCVAQEIGRIKGEGGQAVLDPGREVAIVRRAAERATALGLPDEPVRAVFWQLVGMCRAAQVRP